MDTFFKTVEKYKAPSTILFRSIELKLLKRKLHKLTLKRPILDIGCGDGLAAFLVFGKRLDIGLDNEKRYVELAKKSGAYKKVVLADACDMPLKDNSVNTVFSNCVIEHIKDLDSVLDEVSRVLKDKGYFIFTAPSDTFNNYGMCSKLRLSSIQRLYGKWRNKKYDHYNCYSLKQWKNILKKKGLIFVNGYNYVGKQTLEFWEGLLILFFMLSPFGKSIKNNVYKLFFRDRIYATYKNAKTTDAHGSASCIIAQKL